MGKSERDRGRRFELAVAHTITALGWPTERHTEPGHAREDLVIDAAPWLAVETKDRGRTELAAWVNQAQAQAGPHRVGVVVHKRRGVADPARSWVTMELQDFVRILDRTRP